MKPKQRRLVREQMEATLQPLLALRQAERPVRGWLRAVREALNMSGRQFARRLGVSSSWITMLEQKELHGAVTLKTMQQAAEALDCRFVYAIVPKESLARIVERQALLVARRNLASVEQSMLLEGQQLEVSEQRRVLQQETEDLMREMPRELWDVCK